jgi:hypothetical protein
VQDPALADEALSFNIYKWSPEILEIAGIEHLDTCVVLSVKRGHGAWAACLLGILCGVEPQTQLVNVDRS